MLRYDGVYSLDTNTFIPKWISDDGNTLFLNAFIDGTGVTGERWIFNTQGEAILVSEREVSHDFIDGESGWLLYDPNTLQIIGGAFCLDHNSFHCSRQFNPSASPSLRPINSPSFRPSPSPSHIPSGNYNDCDLCKVIRNFERNFIKLRQYV